MRKRLYYMLPDVHSARQMLDEMLLMRVEERHIHFLAKRGTLPDDLPEASVLQKTDIVHGAETGLIIGGVAGTLGGALAVWMPPAGMSLQLVTVLVTALGVAAGGAPDALLLPPPRAATAAPPATAPPTMARIAMVFDEPRLSSTGSAFVWIILAVAVDPW